MEKDRLSELIGPDRFFNVWAINADGTCSCGQAGCDSVGRHPRKFGTPQLGAGYGVETGAGLLVVDLDVKGVVDGLDAFREAMEAAGGDPEELRTFTVRTGSGGFHLYFRVPEDKRVRNSVSKLAKGVDIRGDGGFVVGPGSPHKSGGLYTIALDVPVVDCPDWLAEWPGLWLSRAAEPNTPGGGWQLTPLDPESDESKARAGRFRADCLTWPAAIQGQGGSRSLWDIALRGVRYYELADDVALEAIETHYNPRCSPPWTTQEILHKMQNAREDSDRPPGCPPEGWAERMSALAIPAALRVQPSETGKAVRQRPDPEHTYTFTAGLDQAAGERKKYPFSFLVYTLQHHSSWAGSWQWDNFAQRLLCVNPPMRLDAEKEGLSDEDVGAVRCWFESMGVACGTQETLDAIRLAAKGLRFHPVLEYLDGLEPCEGDPLAVLSPLAARWFGATQPAESEFLVKFLVGAVRRIYDPGCKNDLTLVLRGEQNVGKSKWLKTLFSPWDRDQMPELTGRDASHALEGYWAVELGELDKILRQDPTTTKDFLTRQVDTYRAFGTGAKIVRPRSCVFVGTTNEDDFLRDPTGNRRYLPILVLGDIPHARVRADRDQVWAAARALALGGGYVIGAGEQPGTVFPHWFTRSDDTSAAMVDARARFTLSDTWAEDVQDFLAGVPETTIRSVYLDGIAKGDPDALLKFDRKIQLRIGQILRQLGCATQVRRDEHGHVVRYWQTPESILGRAPSAEEARRRKGRSGAGTGPRLVAAK